MGTLSSSGSDAPAGAKRGSAPEAATGAGPAVLSGVDPGGVRYRVGLLRASQFLLDGGGMFGLIPRVVWEKAVTPDEKHRVRMMHNCLLLEPVEASEPDGADRAAAGPRRILIEAGTGDKLNAKMSRIFELDGRTAESEVVRVGRDPASVDMTIVTHLHFDHAGGLTRRVRDGETPHWEATRPGAASGDEPRVRFSFPAAQLVVQRREWADARANDSVMTRTYYRDHILPFEDRDLDHLPDGRPRLRLVESARPFPLNRKPSRREMPKSPLEERVSEVAPGVFCFLVPGHTWGQQAVGFRDADGRAVVFPADLLPTRHHVGEPYSLAYDVEAFTTMVTKHWFLNEAVDRGWVLCLDHEPEHPFFTVARDEARGWFRLEEAAAPAGLIGD